MKSLISETCFSIKSCLITSRACTSSTTRASRVALCSLVMLVRTRATMPFIYRRVRNLKVVCLSIWLENALQSASWLLIYPFIAFQSCDKITYLGVKLVVKDLQAVDATFFHSFLCVLGPLHHADCEDCLSLPLCHPRFTGCSFLQSLVRPVNAVSDRRCHYGLNVS